MYDVLMEGTNNTKFNHIAQKNTDFKPNIIRTIGMCTTCAITMECVRKLEGRVLMIYRMATEDMLYITCFCLLNKLDNCKPHYPFRTVL